jgi:hypothetical protein
MSMVLAVLGVLIGFALLWTGLRTLTWASPLKAILSALDLLALAVAIAQLGWALGIALVAGSNLLGFLGWITSGAIHVDAQLSAGAALGTSRKARLRQVYEALNRDRRLKVLGPRRRVELVRLLSERARSPDEMLDMAPAVGLLWIIGDRPPMEWLVERLDSALRLYGMEAARAMEAADTITASTQQSAASFAETLEALVVAGGGSPTHLAPSEGRRKSVLAGEMPQRRT